MRRITLLSTFVLLIALVPTTAALGTDGKMRIVEDTVLFEDHQGTIEINGSDVTLDCAGHSVIGPWEVDGEVDTGVIVNGTGVTVKNCTAEEFEYGFFANNSDIRFENNTAADNDIGFVGFVELSGLEFVGNRAEDYSFVGFLVQQVSYSAFTGNVAVGGGNGIAIYESEHILVEGNHVSDAVRGILIEDSTFVDVVGNTIEDTSEVGIEFNKGFDSTIVGNVISHSTIVGNVISRASYGIVIQWSDFVVAERNTVRDSLANGFEVIGASHNTLTDNTSNNNLGAGFVVDGGLPDAPVPSMDNKLERNTATGNEIGFVLGGLGSGTNNKLEENKASRNVYGFLLNSATGNTLERNTARKNEVGIVVFESVGNPFEENVVGSNQVGIWASTATGNTYLENRCTGNRDADSVPDGLCAKSR